MGLGLGEELERSGDIEGMGRVEKRANKVTGGILS